MKKLHFLMVTLSILVTLGLHAQIQRLALLPAALQGGEDALSSICIDLFRDAPSGEAYGEIGNSFEKKYTGKSLDKVVNDHAPNTPAANTTKFLGTTNEEIPQYYQNFINAKIDEYKNRSDLSTKEKKAMIQLEVWTYNGLDQFGYIDRKISTKEYQLQQYKKAKKGFSSKYFGDENADVLDIEEQLELIHANRKYAKPQLSNLKVSSNKVSYSIDGVAKSIDLLHDGITASEVSSNASAIRQGIQKYNDSYHMAPDFAELSIHSKPQFNYLLYVSDDSEYYTMYFNIANGRLTILPNLNSMYCFLNKR